MSAHCASSWRKALSTKNKSPQQLHFESELCSAFGTREAHVCCQEQILGPEHQCAASHGSKAADFRNIPVLPVPAALFCIPPCSAYVPFSKFSRTVQYLYTLILK